LNRRYAQRTGYSARAKKDGTLVEQCWCCGTEKDEDYRASPPTRQDLTWYICAEALYTSCIWKNKEFPLPDKIGIQINRLPLLTYALGLHPLVKVFEHGTELPGHEQWFVAFARFHDELICCHQYTGAVGLKIITIIPDIELLKWLLNHGFGPNEEIGHHTVWECVVYVVHILRHLHEPCLNVVSKLPLDYFSQQDIRSSDHGRMWQDEDLTRGAGRQTAPTHTFIL
jgi:hypothetical protein